MADVSKNASMEQHRASQEGLGIGRLITGDQYRDAIHVAIVPMVAGARLFAALHVSVANGTAFPSQTDRIGIVDPFLTDPVMPGERFWLFLYPGSITSLRHVWTHPGLDDESGGTPTTPVTGKEASEKWMRTWAMEHMSVDYYGDYGAKLTEDAAYDNAIRAGENQHIGPYEDAREHIDDEWWTHWETITGRKGSRGEYFSCSC